MYRYGTVFARRLPTPSNSLPEVLITPQSSFQEGLDTDIFNRVAPLTKKEATFFATPMKKLKVKIEIQEATDVFKNYQRFIFYLSSISLYQLYLVRQSLKGLIGWLCPIKVTLTFLRLRKLK
jgi:hypothetical protein